MLDDAFEFELRVLVSSGELECVTVDTGGRQKELFHKLSTHRLALAGTYSLRGSARNRIHLWGEFYPCFSPKRCKIWIVLNNFIYFSNQIPKS